VTGSFVQTVETKSFALESTGKVKKRKLEAKKVFPGKYFFFKIPLCCMVHTENGPS